MDEEEKKKKEELEKKRGVLKRIADAFGFGKTSEDIQHENPPARPNYLDLDEEGNPKKKKKPEEY